MFQNLLYTCIYILWRISPKNILSIINSLFLKSVDFESPIAFLSRSNRLWLLPFNTHPPPVSRFTEAKTLLSTRFPVPASSIWSSADVVIQTSRTTSRKSMLLSIIDKPAPHYKLEFHVKTHETKGNLNVTSTYLPMYYIFSCNNWHFFPFNRKINKIIIIMIFIGEVFLIYLVYILLSLTSYMYVGTFM